MIKISQFNAGKTAQRYQYKSFEPVFINTEWELDNSELILLLSKADKKIGELNAFSQLLPDVDFFISMHIIKESTSSSRIEGTRTNIEQAIQKEENIAPENRDDWHEVQNYIRAMNQSIEDLKSLPLSNRLIRHAHAILLQGVRGEHKQPGEFRKSQNWIGGSSIADAVFIPPYNDSIPELMSDFEKFLNNENIALPHLIKIGIAHYQFETIHPFLDGNGRIGRLLISLYLVSNELLSKPTLYLSDFFEKNRSLYYDNLQRARAQNDLVQWLKFFLQGIITTSENAVQTFKDIIKLKEETEKKIVSLGRRQKNGLKLLQYLYTRPIIDINQTAGLLEIDFSTAVRLIDTLHNMGILEEITGYKRNKQFVFKRYVELFR